MPDNRRPRPALPSVESAERFIARYPDPKEAVRVLLRDVKDYRNQLRDGSGSDERTQSTISTLRDENAELERENGDLLARVPKADEVVVKKADAELLPKYQALGKPEDIDAALKREKVLAAKDETNTQLSAAEIAAKAHGFDVDAMKTLTKDLGLIVEIKDETVDNKAVKVAYVKRASDPKEKAPEKLTDFAKNNPVYGAALKAKSGDPAGDQILQTSDLPTVGTEFPVGRSSSDSSSEPSSAVDKAIKAQHAAAAARGNPLKPAKQTESTK